MSTARTASRDVAIGVLCGVLAAAGFSLKAVLAKLVYRHHVDATTLLALRMGLSAPLYALIGLRASRGAPELSRGDYARTAAIGIVGYFFASYFDFLGLEHISAGLERLVLYLYPTLVLVIGLVLYGKRIRMREIVAVLFAYAGLALALSRDVQLGRSTSEIALGVALVFGSALTYAMYVVGSGRLVHRVGSARFTSIAMLAAAVPMLATFVVRRGTGGLAALPNEVLGLAVLMAIAATVLPSLLMTEGIRRLGSSRAAIVGSIGPITTIGLESALLGERVTWPALVGTVLVVVGVLGATLETKPAAEASR